MSSHTIHKIICGESDPNISRPEDVDLYLRLNEQHPTFAARCKILMMHPHLDMRPFLQWDLTLLPLVLTWFEQAKTCTTLNVQVPASPPRRVVEESVEAFESRVLSAMYEFVRGMSMQVMESRIMYWSWLRRMMKTSRWSRKNTRWIWSNMIEWTCSSKKRRRGLSLRIKGLERL